MLSATEASGKLSFTIADGVIDVDGMVSNCDRHTKTLLGGMGLGSQLSLDALLFALCLHVTVKPHRQGAKMRIAAVLASLIKHVGRALDIPMHDTTTADFSDLPFITGAKGVRPRKVPQQYKLAISTAARQSSNKRAWAQGSIA
eukprot:101504-Amphidinium_carterae.1